MIPAESSFTENAGIEIAALIETLLATEQRLEELTGGEVDTVASRDGRTFMLRRAQAQVRFSEAASEATMATAQRIAHFGSWDLDLTKTGATEAKELRWSDEMFRIAGYEPGAVEVTNESFFCLVHPEDRERVRQARATAIRDRHEYSIVHRIIRPDGEIRVVQETAQIFFDGTTGHPAKIVGTAHDITERKQAEIASVRWAALVEFSDDAIIGKDLNGVVTSWNRGAAKLFGYTANEMVGTSITRLIPLDRQGEENQILTRIGRGESVEPFETLRQAKNGRLIDVSVTASPMKDISGTIFGVSKVVRDITERKQAETALEASEAEFRALSEAMPQMVWMTRPDGWNIYFNQQWMDYTGLTLEESLGHGWNQPFHPEDQQRAWDAWQHATATAGVYSIESRLRRADGVYRWWLIRGVPQVDATGNILKWFGTCTDIHDLKSAELEISRANQAQSESKRFAESIAENSTSIIYVFDVEARRNVYTNRSAAEILGYSSVQILEMGDSFLPKVIHPEDLPILSQSYARLAEEQDGFVIESEYRVTHADGNWRWIWARETVFKRRPNGTVWQVMGTAQDITERKRVEAELEKTHSELLEASRLAGMAEVATGILHNVGNVLNSVNVASTCLAASLKRSKAANLGKVVGLLREHEADLGDFLTVNPQGKQIPGYLAQLVEHLAGEQTAALKELAQLQKNIEHIKDIVAMQQGFAKFSGTTELLSVTDLVEDALKMNASALARHDILVGREFQEVPLLRVEKHQVLQILVNLVQNAMQACDETNSLAKQITLRVTRGNDGVRIAVTDNGIGIPTENLTRIFSHGFTTKQSGHGFGLHSAALAAKKMGGSLSVQSEGTGLGTTFTLELPIEQKSSAKLNAA